MLLIVDPFPGGGIMAGKSNNSMKTGEHIIIGGLLIQILFFGFFVIVAVTFHRRMLKVPTTRVLSDIRIASAWKKHIYALYGGSCLILVRSMFRLIEFAQ